MDLFAEKIVPALQNTPVFPVVCLTSREEVDTYVTALLKTPVRCLEITLRHPFAPEAIAYVKKNYPAMLVGAGTVTSKALLKTAVRCGADFLVSPGLNRSLLRMAKRKKIPFLAGVATPSEILAAKQCGLTTLKLFPAEELGGAKLLKTYGDVFAELSFIPTGGIRKEHLAAYLSLKNVVTCGGGFLLFKEKLTCGDVDGLAAEICAVLDEAKASLR